MVIMITCVYQLNNSSDTKAVVRSTQINKIGPTIVFRYDII